MTVDMDAGEPGEHNEPRAYRKQMKQSQAVPSRQTAVRALFYSPARSTRCASGGGASCEGLALFPPLGAGEGLRDRAIIAGLQMWWRRKSSLLCAGGGGVPWSTACPASSPGGPQLPRGAH